MIEQSDMSNGHLAGLAAEPDYSVECASAVIERSALDRREGSRFLDRDGQPIGQTFETSSRLTDEVGKDRWT